MPVSFPISSKRTLLYYRVPLNDSVMLKILSQLIVKDYVNLSNGYPFSEFLVVWWTDDYWTPTTLPRGTRDRTLQIGLVRDRKGPNVTKFPSFLTLRLLLSTNKLFRRDFDTYNTNTTEFVLDNKLSINNSIAFLTGRLCYDEFWVCLFKHDSVISDEETTVLFFIPLQKAKTIFKFTKLSRF